MSDLDTREIREVTISCDTATRDIQNGEFDKSDKSVKKSSNCVLMSVFTPDTSMENVRGVTITYQYIIVRLVVASHAILASASRSSC